MPRHEMIRRKTELPIKNFKNPLRRRLTGPDPTLTHLEAKPEKEEARATGSARRTGDGAETEGSWWPRRVAAEAEEE